MEEERVGREVEQEEEEMENLLSFDFDSEDEIDIDDVMENFNGEDPETVQQFYSFLQSVLQRDEEESEILEPYDETGYKVLKIENFPKHVLFSLDCFFKIINEEKPEEEVIFKSDKTFETSRRSNLQFQNLENKYYGNQSKAYKENSIYFEVEIVHWRKKKYRNHPIIGIGFSPFSFQNGMVGWSSNSIGYHADVTFLILILIFIGWWNIS